MTPESAPIPVQPGGDAVETMIVVTAHPDDADLVSDRMWRWGVRAVADTELADGAVELSTSVGNDRGAIERAVATLDERWRWTTRDVDAAVGRVDPAHLAPTWYAPGMVTVPASIHPAETGDALVTVIDPGGAFGLGDHPTTRSSMAMLARIVTRRAPRCERALDVGCGTGALSVLAAQLGVATVRAIDIADAAVDATRRNAVRNDVAGAIEVDTTPVERIDGEFDVVLANILAPALISMGPDLVRLVRPGGSVVVSGILAARHDHVLDALAPLATADSIVDGDWITIELRRGGRDDGRRARHR
ncbi:50S ribosomal protein L11 methyltransferase [Ilumatobacter sp.]|uniref:50S ribosomal protein L11 methyltransferase n=1 Tax=Ilumatobacter sp. TaxID=1967498 RepID=UPI003B51A952